MDYDQATKTAEKLLRIGTLSYKQISYASGIPLWSIREIQTEMNMERRRLLRVLRKTMLEIGEGIHGAAINEEKLHDTSMMCMHTFCGIHTTPPIKAKGAHCKRCALFFLCVHFISAHTPLPRPDWPAGLIKCTH